MTLDGSSRIASRVLGVEFGREPRQSWLMSLTEQDVDALRLLMRVEIDQAFASRLEPLQAEVRQRFDQVDNALDGLYQHLAIPTPVTNEPTIITLKPDSSRSTEHGHSCCLPQRRRLHVHCS